MSNVHVWWIKFTTEGLVTAGVDLPLRFWRLTGPTADCAHEPDSEPVNAILTRDQDGTVMVGTTTGAVESWDPRAGGLVKLHELRLPDHNPFVEEEGRVLEDNPHCEVTSLTLNESAGRLVIGMMGRCVAYVDL